MFLISQVSKLIKQKQTNNSNLYFKLCIQKLSTNQYNDSIINLTSSDESQGKNDTNQKSQEKSDRNISLV